MAQGVALSPKKKVFFLGEECRVNLDSLTISPYSIRVTHQGGIIRNGFEIYNTEIEFQDSLCNALEGKEITVDYRVLDFNISAPYSHLDSTQMKFKDRAIRIRANYGKKDKGNQIIDSESLDYNGSFSRGFSVGNAQSLILNSNFNLQLAGDLGDGINVVAAISDDNIPIQPEGNTQVIQEFDRVFIKVTKDKTSITAGDYILTRPKSYFINYFKKAQGLSVDNEFSIGDKTITSKGSFAIARGKFARQFLETFEGNQGPYKLTGNAGERFLIVLSGSEKVYLDGQLLERGLDYDYIIDYNRAEVTFTPKRVIGRESRIIVEYEFRDQNYLRSIYAADVDMTSPKYDLSFHFYNEQDSKSATGDIVLDSTDIFQLSGIGDNLDAARSLAIQEVTDTLSFINQIKYRLNTNVLPDDTTAFFLEFSSDINEDLYVASFSEVSQGNGRYVIDETNLINGRVYRYVGPGNGNYEPFTTITPPEKKQMMSISGAFRPKENITIGTEVSLSNNDLNRFSTRDNQDNLGAAAVLNYEQSIKLKKDSRLILGGGYEYVNQNFLFLNPYRRAEFNRDWNLQNEFLQGEQNLTSASIKYAIRDTFELSYNVDFFTISDFYSASNQRTNFRLNHKKITINGKLDVLNSENQGIQSTFLRPKLDASTSISKNDNLRIGVYYEGEQNEIRQNSASDDLSAKSFEFNIYRAYLENKNKGWINYRLSYTFRDDLFPEEDQLVKSIKTDEYSIASTIRFTPKHNLSFNFGLRDFRVDRQDLTPSNSSSKRTLVGQLNHDMNIFKGLVISNTNYIVNSGQEPKVEFFFERVEPGQGDYIYIGNQDSTLINANFRFAPDLGTGDYIRLSLINNEFITTNNQTLSHSLRIDPKKYFTVKRKEERKNKGKRSKNEKSKLEKYLSIFSTVSSARINKKLEQSGSDQGTSFFNFSTQDISLVSFSSLIQNTLFINKGNSKFDSQIGNRRTDNIFTQIGGLEQRSLRESFLRSRVKIHKSTDFITEFRIGNQGYDSVIFPSRNLDVDIYSFNPEISFRPSDNFRIITQYTYSDRQQTINTMERADSHDFTLEATYRRASDTNINLSVSYVNVEFTGEANSAIEFDLLSGLKNGQNFLWNIFFTKRLSNSVDLNINYEGRRSEGSPTIHIARAQVKATF